MVRSVCVVNIRASIRVSGWLSVVRAGGLLRVVFKVRMNSKCYKYIRRVAYV